jgi:serine/threonine-protein kinase
MAAERGDAARAEELDEVILAYVEALEAGQAPDRAAWLARYPHLEAELSSFFADQDQFSSLVAPICVNTPPPSLARGSISLAAPPPLAAGTLVGDYELLDEIAVGGMGVIYKARHRTLGRVVALKMIRAGSLALEEDVARFRFEAEAVARLDHSNIVPIYDVGTHEGQPYFSMKLIDGGNLAQCPPVAPAERARVMMKVARAIHYAHERGILHRDLKPANILLDERGNPHVTDFGLATRLPAVATTSGAKTPSPARSLTQKGIAVGTPGYMAPEQASGPKKGVTVAADVYSLGAVLYEMLTGRPPFKAETPLETLVQVLEQQPPRPRSLVPSVPRDLETICLKCLEKDPTRRYASADALADDLQRYLDGEPIEARTAGPIERLGRWCRRSPIVAGLAAGLALALIGGFAAVTVLWQRADNHWRDAENQRVRAEENFREAENQRLLADAARKQADTERDHAEKARGLAETERQHAEESFQQAHEVVERICMRLGEERLSAFQGLQPLRKEMLDTGIKYYQDFLAKRGNDPTLKAELAKARFRIALLTSQVGSKRDALASYDQALATYDELLTADPGNAGHRLMVASICINRGGTLEAINDREAALKSYLRAREILEEMDRARPDAAEVLAPLGILFNNLGNVYRGLNQLNDSADAYEKAMAVQERRIRLNSKNLDPQRELAVVYVNVAILHATRGDPDESMRWHKKAFELQEKLHGKYGKDRETQHDLALTYRRIGERQVRDGQLDAALKTLEQGHKLIEELATQNGNVTEYLWELALSHRAIGHVHKALAVSEEAQGQARKAAGATEEAAGHFKKASEERGRAAQLYRIAIDQLATAQRQDPSAVMYTRDLAATQFDLAILLSGDPSKADEALTAFTRAADIYRALAKPGTDANALADLATTRSQMGHLLRDRGSQLRKPQLYEEALAAFNEARAIRESLVRLRPEEPQYRNELANAWFNVARLHSYLKQRDQEVQGYEKSRDIREQLVKDFPDNLAYHADFGATLVNLADAYARAGRTGDALPLLRQAVEQKRLAFEASRQTLEFRRGLNIAYGALAEVERKLGTPAASAAALLDRRKLWPNDSQELYIIACEQADTAACVARGKSVLTPAEQMERSTYLDQAMETLSLAVKAGFSNAERLAREPSLAPLRSREDFQKLLPALKKKD